MNKSNNQNNIQNRSLQQDRSLQFGRFLLLLQRMERQPSAYGAAGHFTPSEIHTIDAIGCDGSMLMSEIAAKLNVTKGAITQLASRLEKKGAISRSPHPTDKRAILLSLTEKGVLASRVQEEMRTHFYAMLTSQMDPHEIAIFEKGIDITVQLLQSMFGEDEPSSDWGDV